MRRIESKPHLYMRNGDWIAIQWIYGRRVQDDVFLSVRGHTYISAWNQLFIKRQSL